MNDYINVDEIDIKKQYSDIIALLKTPSPNFRYSTYTPSQIELDILEIPILIKTIKENPPKKEDNIRYINGYREYLINGKWLISITSLIGKVGIGREFIEQWRKKMGDRADEISRETARVGELVHYQILETLKRELPISGDFDMWQELPTFLLNEKIMIPERIKEYQEYLKHAAILTRQFLEIYHNKIKLISIERRVSNSQFRYAGRFDFQFQLFDPLEERWINCLGDIKTSKREYESVKTQLTAYNLSDELNGWGERLYELRIHPYPDHEWDYGWEFILLDHDREGLENAIFKLAELEREELVKKNLENIELDLEYDE